MEPCLEFRSPVLIHELAAFVAVLLCHSRLGTPLVYCLKGSLQTQALPHSPTLSAGWDRCLFWAPSAPAPFLYSPRHHGLRFSVVGTRLTVP